MNRTGYTLLTLLDLYPDIKIDESDIKVFMFKTACLCKMRGGLYVYISTKGKTLALHRLILEAEKDQVVDHINGNTLDNRRLNIRLCTNRENLLKQKLRTDNTSGYKGVTWDSRRKIWVAQITVQGNNKYLGGYENKEAAALSYNQAATAHFGEFAQLNNV